MGDLSEHFSASEFACPHCGECKISPRLIAALEHLRAFSGVPIHVHSGYRCPVHNEQIGGKPHSEHMVGEAADITVGKHTTGEMLRLAERIPEFCNGGIGLYSEGFIHVDVRAGRARWARVNGVYRSTEERTTNALSQPNGPEPSRCV